MIHAMSQNEIEPANLDTQCKICDSKSKKTFFKVKEMMLGLREEFIYVLCNNCRCLQLGNPPSDLEKFYASTKYYSFQKGDRKFDKILMKSSFYQKGLLYSLLNHYLFLDYALVSIGKLNITNTSRILDVGSGAGDILLKLKKLGFEHAIGLDPFIEKDLESPVKVVKSNLSEFKSDEFFDIIMFHHSFEHIPNPKKTLVDAKKILKQNGTILLRTPILSYAFERYGTDWFQIDAPRHFFIYSVLALTILLNKMGLHIENYYCDSTENQFTWSRSYAKNVAMVEAKKGLMRTIKRKLFSQYRKQAILLNEQKKGDQGVFYIRNSE